MLGPEDTALLAATGADVFDTAAVPALAAEFLADPRHHIAAAIRAGRIIGFASGVHYIHPDKPAQMFINEVGVADDSLRQGIGRAVVAALIDHARGIGCGEAWVLTDDDNVAARGLYAAAGGRDGPAGRIFIFDVDACSVRPIGR